MLMMRAVSKEEEEESLAHLTQHLTQAGGHREYTLSNKSDSVCPIDRAAGCAFFILLIVFSVCSL